MKIFIHKTKEELGKAAARKGADAISKAILKRGNAGIILATGTSQFEMLDELTKTGLDWSRVTAFHLDEYIGLPETHPASFRKILKERFADLVSLKKFHYIDGEADPEKECARLGDVIGRHPIDAAFIGIGENGHLAFNDPPADFKTEAPYMTVNLDLVCRNQQFGEGWFPTLKEVPEIAISMSVQQILKSGTIICTVPDKRKATAVKNTLENGISPEIPASILKSHDAAFLYLDRDSSSLMRRF